MTRPCVIVQASAFVVTPLNVVVGQHSTAVLSCSSNSPGVDWLFYDYKNSSGSPCYVYKSNPTPGGYCNDTSRFNVTPSSGVPASYDLVIKADLPDAGESGGQKAAAILGVICTNDYYHHQQQQRRQQQHSALPGSLGQLSLLSLRGG